jgi:hypothetical protein
MFLFELQSEVTTMVPVPPPISLLPAKSLHLPSSRRASLPKPLVPFGGEASPYAVLCIVFRPSSGLGPNPSDVHPSVLGCGHGIRQRGVKYAPNGCLPTTFFCSKCTYHHPLQAQTAITCKSGEATLSNTNQLHRCMKNLR